MTFATPGISLNNLLAGHNGTLPGQIVWDNERLLSMQGNGLKWNTIGNTWQNSAHYFE